MEFLGIIPARYQSTRFPGKPLALINDRPMIEWVYKKASEALDEVYVATDDKRIFDKVNDFGGNVVMTSSAHQSGTDRCREAMETIISGTGIDVDVVINIQGDEPFIRSEQIELLKSCFEKPGTEIASLMKKIENQEEIFDENKPKIVSNADGMALLFSRSPIPFLRGRKKEEWLNYHDFYRHIGIYGYQKEILRKITEMPTSSLEVAESLEQLRWLENGIQIRMEETQWESIGIDTPADLKKAVALLK